VSVGIGEKLRSIRQRWQLSLREVEERSLRFAQERGNLAFKLSASWLNRLEREEHELSVSKLIVLADIYDLSTEQLLRFVQPEDQHSLIKPPCGPNATMLLTGGRLDDQATTLLGYHLKTGHTLSVQNRPTRLAEDVIVLPCRIVRLQDLGLSFEVRLIQ
jgi:transcriptional regulator with XRE-family HTH domain